MAVLSALPRMLTVSISHYLHLGALDEARIFCIQSRSSFGPLKEGWSGGSYLLQRTRRQDLCFAGWTCLTVMKAKNIQLNQCSATQPRRTKPTRRRL